MPIGILIEPTGERAFIARTKDNKVSVIDLINLKTIAEFHPGNEPDGMGFVLVK